MDALTTLFHTYAPDGSMTHTLVVVGGACLAVLGAVCIISCVVACMCQPRFLDDMNVERL